MTIIAVDVRAGRMLADTLVTVDGSPAYHATKIIRTPDGSLAGAGGEGDQCCAFLDWARAGFKGKPRLTLDNIVAVHLSPARKLRVFFDSACPEEALDTVLAVGTGKLAFQAAFRAGASLADAVSIACELDPNCGLPLTSLDLEDRW